MEHKGIFLLSFVLLVATISADPSDQPPVDLMEPADVPSILKQLTSDYAQDQEQATAALQGPVPLPSGSKDAHVAAPKATPSTNAKPVNVDPLVIKHSNKANLIKGDKFDQPAELHVETNRDTREMTIGPLPKLLPGTVKIHLGHGLLVIKGRGTDMHEFRMAIPVFPLGPEFEFTRKRVLENFHLKGDNLVVKLPASENRGGLRGGRPYAIPEDGGLADMLHDGPEDFSGLMRMPVSTIIMNGGDGAPMGMHINAQDLPPMLPMLSQQGPDGLIIGPDGTPLEMGEMSPEDESEEPDVMPPIGTPGFNPFLGGLNLGDLNLGRLSQMQQRPRPNPEERKASMDMMKGVMDMVRNMVDGVDGESDGFHGGWTVHKDTKTATFDVELPSSSGIKVKVHNVQRQNYVTVSQKLSGKDLAAAKEAHPDAPLEEGIEEHVSLPYAVDPANVKASYKNGALTLTIPMKTVKAVKIPVSH